MRARSRRGLLPAAAAVAGAAVAHLLDVAGLLPGVHEAAEVRGAMGPAATLCWLGLAALLGVVAARTRPGLVGGPAALAVSAVPELVGRHDPGAVGEPGALAGALLQWLLLLVVVALAVAVERRLHRPPPPRVPGLPVVPPVPFRAGRPCGPVACPGRPRAPPARPLAH